MIRTITRWIRTARRLVRRATRHLILVRIHTTITQTHSEIEIPAGTLSSGINSHNPEYCMACKYLPAYIKKQLPHGKHLTQAEFDQLISDYHNSYSRN